MTLYEPSNFDENDPLLELGAELLRLNRDEYGVAVHRSVNPDDSWFIVWSTDHVANEWRDAYPSLATALAHVSALEFAVTAETTLTTSRGDVTAFAEAFHRAVTWQRPSEEDR